MQLAARRELVWSLVGRNLKIRYKGSLLGFFWSLLTPLFFILIYGAFARLLKFGGEGFLPYLVTGIVVWQLVTGVLNDSLHSVAGNANLVKKVFFPRQILPFATAIADGVNFLLTFAVLLLFLAVTGSLRPGASAWLLLPAFAMHVSLCLGLALLSSSLNVFFRDTEHLAGIVSQAWFFLTPVMYPMDFQTGMLASKSIPAIAAYANPATGIVSLYRKALLGIEVPGLTPGAVLLSAAASLLFFAAGWLVFSAGEKKFGDVL